jgi:lipooligosaccharide transport system permease protein
MTEVADQTAVPAPSIGRVPGPVRGTLVVVEGFWTWYRKHWRATAVSSVVQPVLFLVALGMGFGTQVRPGAATLGLPYVAYLAPALLVVTAVQIAAFESSYPVVSMFKWQRQYLAMAASPITAAQILGGHLTWIAIRIASSGLAYLVVAAVLGALTGPGVVLSLVVAVLTGMAVAAPVMAYAATLETEASFAGMFRFILLPMTLFAGTFFPVDTLPAWLRPLAWVTPLWHGTEVARGTAFGGLHPLAMLGHLAYLAAMFAITTWLAARLFRRRLEK